MADNDSNMVGGAGVEFEGERNADNLEQFLDFMSVGKMRSIRRIAQSYATWPPGVPFQQEVHEFRRGAFHMTECYRLGEPLSGQEMVCFEGRPIWLLNYFGSSLDSRWPASPECVIEMLKLSAMNLLQIGGPGGWLRYNRRAGDLYTVRKLGGMGGMHLRGEAYQGGRAVYQFTCYGGLVGD